MENPTVLPVAPEEENWVDLFRAGLILGGDLEFEKNPDTSRDIDFGLEDD